MVSIFGSAHYAGGFNHCSNPAGEESAKLTACIMRLPHKLQEATLLHYYQNMTTGGDRGSPANSAIHRINKAHARADEAARVSGKE